MEEKQWSRWLEYIKSFSPSAKYWTMPTTTQEAFTLMQHLGKELEFLSKDIQYWHKCANTDFLTGLANRRRLIEEFNHQFTTFFSPIIVLFIDINGFKKLNDVYGHTTGDNILCRLADKLSEYFHGCTITRLGGDEFVVASHGKSTVYINGKINKLKKHLSKQPVITTGKHRIYISVSVGISIRKRASTENKSNNIDLQKMLEEADLAMYKDKHVS